jgi:hypothetical protein
MYLFYVDESGSLDPDANSICANGRRKEWLYVLTAFGLFEHNWRKFYHPIVQHKRELINTIQPRIGARLNLEECEVKSTWLRIPSRRAERPFLNSLSPEELTGLSEIYFSQLDALPSVIISVAVDKRHLASYMDREKLHRKAWELLCERIDLYMREHHRKHRAVIVADDVNLQANYALARKHAFFLEHGTSAGVRFKHIVEMPLFVRSELSEGIQLADLLSYSIYRAIRDNNPDYPYFARVRPFLYNSGNTPAGKLDGMKIFPDASPLSGWPNSKK